MSNGWPHATLEIGGGGSVTWKFDFRNAEKVTTKSTRLGNRLTETGQAHEHAPLFTISLKLPEGMQPANFFATITPVQTKDGTRMEVQIPIVMQSADQIRITF